MNRIVLALTATSLFAAAACRAGPSAFDQTAERMASVDGRGLAVLAVGPTASSAEWVGATSETEAMPSLYTMEGTSGVTVPYALATPDSFVEDERFEDLEARFPRPRKIRGVYVNAWAAGSSRRMEALFDLARRTEVNSFVIDIKDASGYLSHRTQIPLALEIGSTEEVRIRDLPGLLDRLEEEGVYPIARIVIVKDPILAESRPELAIQDTAGGVWADQKGVVWLNAYDERVWEYHLDIAREVADLGFPEIQWDYVRFPDAPRSDLDRAVFTGSDGRSKSDAIREFLKYGREQLAERDVRATADVFGVITSAAEDVGIGQNWAQMADAVDVMLPMVYPSHYAPGSFGIEEPNAYPYEIVRNALRDAVRRSEEIEGAGRTRPWLQDFTLGSPRYGGPEVRAQIQATYDAGVDEWVLWNPGSRYTESGLEPVDGFATEPLVRVAGGLHPVSYRQEAMDSVRAAIEDAAAAEVARTRVPDVDDGVPEVDVEEGAKVDSVGVAASGGAREVAAADTVGAGD